jgi:GntR family transcriptional regulator, trigonelline degradation regulator
MAERREESKHRLQMSARPVRLREQVLAALRTAILEFQFQPGQRLVERELCEMTGVSRTSVREALRHLESEGLVENIPNRGPIVAVVTPDKARYIYELRGALEALAAGLFAERADSRQMRRLETAYQQLKPTLESMNQRRTLTAVNQFYDALLDGCGNPLIGQVLRSLHGRIVYLRAISISQGRVPESLEELGRIVQAVRRRDAAASERACKEHAARACIAALGALTHGDPAPRPAHS